MEGACKPLMPLREGPETSGLFLDFDGTISPIVSDPSSARPLPGVARLLSDLADRFKLVAVVSGRPASFLQERLSDAKGVRLFGLYGLEEAGAGGEIIVTEAAERWRSIVSDLVTTIRSRAPSGARVEDKGLTFTLHWREAPAAQDWAEELARATTQENGLIAQRGRMAIELRPPVHSDKGTVVRSLAPGLAAVACFGDDLGDLPAFAALDELAETGVAVARVAVKDPESPQEVLDAADLVVLGPQGAAETLRWLLGGN